MELIIADEEPKPDVIECKGLFFRGYRNVYHQGTELHMKQGFKLLKRMSCTGCEKCGFFDDMGEMIEGDCVIYPDSIKHGGLYTLKVSNIGYDWESGHADSWDFEYVEVV
jgi:hypothetical protein